MNRFSAGLVVAALATPAIAATPIDETIDADRSDLLSVVNSTGSVTVRGWSGDEVVIAGELADAAQRLDVRRESDRILVHVIGPDDGHRRARFEGTILEITAPRELAVEVNTVSASITIDEMQAEQELSTVSGTIDTVLYGAEIFAKSVSGAVHIEGRGDRTRAEVTSVSGNVDVEAFSGEVRAQTVSGRAEIESPLLERADVKSVSGSIDIDATLSDSARLRAVTTSGGISLNLRGDTAGRYDLTTFSGRIDNCFGPEPERSSFGPPSPRLRFDEGDGNARIDANSMSGSIELCRSRQAAD